MNRPNRALLCDLDGTLADTLPTLVRTYERFVTARGGEPSHEEFARLNGLPVADALVELCRSRGWYVDFAELLAQYEAAIDCEYAGAVPRDGARDLLMAARELRWRCAVVTSGRRDRAGAWLSASGLGDLVDTLVSADDVRRGKPNPESYLLALRRLRADPIRSLAVEDSETGAASARDAGVRTYFLHSGSVAVPAGTVAITDLAELTREVARVGRA